MPLQMHSKIVAMAYIKYNKSDMYKLMRWEITKQLKCQYGKWLYNIERWERKRSKCFFTYTNLDHFRSHHSIWGFVIRLFKTEENFPKRNNNDITSHYIPVQFNSSGIYSFLVSTAMLGTGVGGGLRRINTKEVIWQLSFLNSILILYQASMIKIYMKKCSK